MENASKALIIAGAILLSILIIAIGMYIYNSAQSTVMNSAGAMNEQEIASFNQVWEMYDGQQTGANVKAMISKLATNYNTYTGEKSKQPILHYDTDSSNATAAAMCCATDIASYNKARSAIQARHTYYVTIVNSDTTALVHHIFVSYENVKGKSILDEMFDYSKID